MLAEHVQNLLRRPAFLRARIQLAVRIGSCPTLAKAVVALSVHLLRLSYQRQVLLPLVHVLAALQHHWSQAQLDEPQRRKQSPGACAHDDDLRRLRHVLIVRPLVGVVLRLLVDVGTHLQVDKDGALAGVDAPAQHAQCGQRTHVQAILAGHPLAQRLLVSGHMGLNPKLKLLNHWSCGEKFGFSLITSHCQRGH